MSKRHGGARRRRLAPGPRGGTARTGLLALGAALLAVALLALAGARSSTAPGHGDAPRRAPVSSVMRSCPAAGVGKKTADEQVGVTSIPLFTTGGGDRSAVRLPDGDPIDALVPKSPGAWATHEVTADKTGAVVLSANGRAAPGTVAFGASRAGDELGGGVAVTDCPETKRERWFVGAGSSAEHQTTLVLTNPTEAPAVVDVTLYGDKGPVEAVGGDGIDVDPGSVKRLEIQDLAAGESEVAVHAVVSRGAVSATALDIVRSGSSPRGTEWIPSSAAPARRQVVAGADGGDRTLLIANPGERTATVEVQMIGKGGTFTAKKLDQVEVKPGSVQTAELPSQVGKKAVGIALSSDLPVTASARTEKGGGSDADLAYAAARAPVARTAVMPLDLGKLVKPSDATLMINGRTDDDTTVTVSGYDRDGKVLGDTEVTAPAGTTAAFDPPAKGWGRTDRLAYLTVKSQDGPIHATAIYETADGISSMPVSAAPALVPVPAAEPGS